MAEKKKPTKKKADKAEVVVPERMGQPVGKELFEINPEQVKWTLDRIDSLVKVVRESYVELAKHLYAVAEGAMFKSLGFSRFDEYVADHLGWSERKGWHFVTIYRNLVVMNDGGDKVSGTVIEGREDAINELGWNRASILSALPNAERTPNKFPSWMQRAKDLGEAELKAEVRKAKNDDLGKKVYSEEVTTKETFGFYPAQHKNVELALEIAKKASGSEVKSNNMDLICAEFVASRAEEAGVKLQRQLDNLERAFKCKIVAFSENGDRVLYGAKVAKQYGIS